MRRSLVLLSGLLFACGGRGGVAPTPTTTPTSTWPSGPPTELYPPPAHPAPLRTRLQSRIFPGLRGHQFAKPDIIAVADFDEDHRDDFLWNDVIAGEGPTLERSNGDGTFTLMHLPIDSLPSTPPLAKSIHVVDANGDGHLDVYGQGYSALKLWLGHGDGTFDVPISVGADWGAWVDLDGDKRADLVVAKSSGGPTPSLAVTTQLAQADGTLAAAVAAGSYPPATAVIVVGDFDGNGAGDLVVVETQPAQLSFYPGAGDGTFAAAASSTTTLSAASSCDVVGDLDGDGRADLHCAPTDTSATAQDTIFLGSANGPVVGVTLPFAVRTCRDWDGDGTLDAIGQDRWARGHGDGTFDAALPLPDFGPALSYGDFDGDGLLDGTDGETALRSPVGAYSRRIIDVAGDVTDFAVVDADHDGRPDLVTSSPTELVLFLQQADGSFVRHLHIGPYSGGGIGGLRAADIDGDGLTDLLWLQGGQLMRGRSDGQGGFSVAPLGIAAPVGAATFAIGDADGDGALDVAFSSCRDEPNSSGCSATMCMNRGGTFQCDDATIPGPLPGSGAMTPVQTELVDLDQDGRADFIVTLQYDTTAQAYVSWNAGDGPAAMFEPLLSGGPTTGRVAIADVDGDGRPDVIGSRQSWYSSRGIDLGIGDGVSVLAADLDGDAYADVLSAYPLTEYPGGPAGLGKASTEYDETNSVGRLVDMDGDGLPDLVQLHSTTSAVRIEVLRNVPLP